MARVVIIGLVALLLTFDATWSFSTPSYRRENLLKLCPIDGTKKPISLGTKATILTLSVDSVIVTFNCHLELEAPTGYGIHVFMQEMNLLGSEAMGTCKNHDSIQFGRDVLAFTTYKSPLYCGYRPNVNFSDEQEAWKHYDGSMTRFHVEERDHEMDFWLRLSPSKLYRTRSLTLIATVFKLNCDPRRERDWRRCNNTRHCIRKEYFCDGHVNCAWPNGDMATDEGSVACDAEGNWHGNPEGNLGPGLSASNLPIIVIVAVVIVGVVTIFVIGLCRVYTSYSRAHDEDSGEGASARRRHNRSAAEGDDALTSPPLLQPSAPRRPSPSAEANEAAPSAPPSYEEAVKNSDMVLEAVPQNPPPYSESVAESSTS